MDANLEEARSLFFQGIEHFEGGRLAEARSKFEASLALAPGRPSVLGNLGITLFHLGQWRQAIAPLQQAAAADQAYAEAWACLGLARAELMEWRQAVEALEKALALSPKQAGLWLSKGQGLIQLGRVGEALQAFDSALAINPQFAAAWSERGSLLRELHRLDEAADCFEKALACGGDRELNAYYLASVKGAETPATAPRSYVETLFDDYAADFQSHLVGQLRYQGYEVLLRPLVEAGRRFSAALDLGCGTGLCGPLIRPLAAAVDGVDLSRAMLEEAAKLGVYRELIHADLLPFLESTGLTPDLVVAADVFIYVGDLAPVFRSVRRILAPGGSFIFTAEVPSDGRDMQLLPSLRYAHSEAYVRRLAEDCGFAVDSAFQAPIRYDQTKPIQGSYFYLS